jgi:hypothetical protein
LTFPAGSVTLGGSGPDEIEKLLVADTKVHSVEPAPCGLAR